MERTEEEILKGKEKKETSQGLLPQQVSIILPYLLDITHLPHNQDHLFRDTLLLLAEKELLHHLTHGQSLHLYDALLLLILHILCLPLRESRVLQDIVLQRERKGGMIMSELHSLTIGVMRGGKRLEAKGIEKRTREKNESMNRIRALLETTEMTESLEMVGIGEIPEMLETEGN